jgi:hypothetical protein
MSTTELRTGQVHLQEWSGLWKASPNVSVMSEEEFDAAWKSLTSWLRERYAVDWIFQGQRHLFVDGDFGEDRERTLTVVIEVEDALTLGLLRFIQDWLRTHGRLWRVAVPIRSTRQDCILVYPEAIRVGIDPAADVRVFLEAARSTLAQTIEAGRKQFKLGPRRGYPPLPDMSDYETT